MRFSSMAFDEGNIPSEHHGTKTIGHSMPFAWWMVESVTLSASTVLRLASRLVSSATSERKPSSPPGASAICAPSSSTSFSLSFASSSSHSW